MTLEDLPQDMDPLYELCDRGLCHSGWPVGDPGRDKEMLGSTDVKPVLLRRLWIRDLTALLEGRAITDWKVPSEPIGAMESA